MKDGDMRVEARRLSVLFVVMALAQPAFAQESSLEVARAAAGSAPTDAQAQRNLGLALIEAGRYPEATTQMQKVVKLEKSSPASLYDVQRVKLAQGDYNAARKGCQEILKEAPEEVMGHVCMARAYLVWRRSSRAVEHVDAAIARDPSNYEALLVDADTRLMEGALDAAATAYQKVLDKFPWSADAWLGTSQIHVLRNQPKQAMDALRKALLNKPNNPDVLLALGKLTSGTEAVGLLQRAVAARPDSVEAKLALATAQIRAGEAKSAEPMLRAILKKDPKNVPAATELGAALVALGSYPEAEKLLRGSLEKMPNDFDASFALAQLFEKTGQNEEAFTQYRNAADLKRDSLEPLLAAARLGLALARPQLAGALLERALERAPKSAEAHALYGDAMVARGDKAGAKDHYQKALAGEGAFDRAHVQKQLAGLK
jgi:tetratricopeptide (TPR) repeat protein